MAEKIINKYAEDGICYPNTTLNIRSMPCATTGEVLDQYYEGESVIYDYVVITDQYVWISWLSSGGNRRVYMAVKEQATGERLGLCTDIPIGSGGNQGAEVISNEYAEDGICYPNRTINIRSIPCATTGIILDQYYEGESVIYDYVIITDQYVWISWISAGGRRVYMVVKEQATGERYALITDVPGGGSGSSGAAEKRVKEYSETGICYPSMTLNIRTVPCTVTGEILDQYYDGESVVYDYVVITDQHVWISWTSAGSGRRVYMAVKDQTTGERFGFCTDIPGSGGSAGGGAPMPGVKKVFIDPGHGGSDPGAAGHGLKEDEIVLNIAKKLGNLLTSKGIAVKYSRTSDVYVDLAERSRLANEWEADLFVSVHANAFNGSSYGTECYTHPGDSSEAKQLSANVASTISSKLGLYNRGHKEADFAVLRLAKMPAILIETAFIDNEKEAIILKEKADDFANAIYKAITGSDTDSTPPLDYSELFQGDYLQSIIDNSWLLNQMAFEYKSEKFIAKGIPKMVSFDPTVIVRTEIERTSKIGNGDHTLTYDGTSTLAANIMGKYTGSDININFDVDDLKDMLKMAGVVVPVGEYLTIAAKPIGVYGVEITAEYQIGKHLLPEKFKNHPVYVRVVITIFKNIRLGRLYLPLYTSKEVYQIESEAGVDWNKIAKVGGDIIEGIVVAAVLTAVIITIGAAITSGVGAGAGVAAASAGVNALSYMFVH
ncbi:sporulation-specific N-acetylmuramoyl-L-alanine amidase CwlC [Clostridium sartagoforme AAU1]|uniref:Sporulation-specific N-acetylmuramoyl-L-alanine amidase CwlC n=1 Tax=Clostridium sartagoforme AAU1 TaxID=1202534 RepID=R9BSJ0_9CLOT|nr:N-acetylmuramoyl-L-alanine amidase [Clostridium sartagoforme]EOR19972.1 sporulation-specific N-acetylmuramoyl-L-alanine amidase CwlC [Clostridium sartagoforme AAU1]